MNLFLRLVAVSIVSLPICISLRADVERTRAAELAEASWPSDAELQKIPLVVRPTAQRN